MMHCGLLGQKLSHSYSPAIHSMLGDYEYKLYETEPENVETFLRKGDFDALNVTIPYKKCAAAICDELSETARAIGSVNTIVRRADGTLYGDNTDVYGFEELLRRAVFSPRAKKVLVLGSGRRFRRGGVRARKAAGARDRRRLPRWEGQLLQPLPPHGRRAHREHHAGRHVPAQRRVGH